MAVLLLLVLTIGAAGVFAYNEINGNGGKPGAEVTVSIPQGSGVAAIAKELKEAGVIRSAYLFRWYVGHKGAAGKLQYGDFTLQTGGHEERVVSTFPSVVASAVVQAVSEAANQYRGRRKGTFTEPSARTDENLQTETSKSRIRTTGIRSA